MTEADEFEVGSIFNSGSKKQSLNHLLNFQFEPRGVNSTNGRRKRGGGEGGGKRSSGQVTRPKYKKEHYLQAK